MRAYDLNPQQPEMNQLRQAALALGGTVASFATYLQSFSDSIIYDQRAEVFGSEGMAAIGNDSQSSVQISNSDGVTGEKPLFLAIDTLLSLPLKTVH